LAASAIAREEALTLSAPALQSRQFDTGVFR